MAAASFTKLTAAPDMLRYHLYSLDGAAGSKTAAQLIADCAAGPLKKLLAQMNTAGSWGAVSATLAAPNPATNARISVTLTPYTAGSGTISAYASYQWYADEGGNILEILGGLRGDTTTLSKFTSAILEIRYNHSVVR